MFFREVAPARVDGPKPMHIWAALNKLRAIKRGWEAWKGVVEVF